MARRRPRCCPDAQPGRQSTTGADRARSCQRRGAGIAAIMVRGRLGPRGRRGCMSESEKPNDDAGGSLPSRRFEGREEFRQLVRDALATAAREGWRELILSDATFSDWPLGERVVVDSLRAWSKTGRHCTLLAKRYDDVVRAHPRFVQ